MGIEKEINMNSPTLVPWKPNLALYRSDSTNLYKANLDFEELTQRPGHTSVQYMTDIIDTEPKMKMCRDVTNQIKQMMRNSLPNSQPKG